MKKFFFLPLLVLGFFFLSSRVAAKDYDFPEVKIKGEGVKKYSDTAEFYWRLIGEGWDKKAGDMERVWVLWRRSI